MMDWIRNATLRARGGARSMSYKNCSPNYCIISTSNIRYHAQLQCVGFKLNYIGVWRCDLTVLGASYGVWGADFGGWGKEFGV